MPDEEVQAYPANLIGAIASKDRVPRTDGGPSNCREESATSIHRWTPSDSAHRQNDRSISLSGSPGEACREG